jgi:hypothetical protein
MGLTMLSLEGANYGGGMDLANDVERARTYFGLDQRALEMLVVLGTICQDVKEELINGLYQAIDSWPEVRDAVDAAALERAKEAQHQYFDELFSGRLDLAHCQRRRRIGAVHDEVGIQPYWYLAAYCFYLNRLHAYMVPRFQGIPVGTQTRILQALTKMVLHDAALAWEGYTVRRDQRIDQLTHLTAGQQNLRLQEMERTARTLLDTLGAIANNWDRLLQQERAGPGPEVSSQLTALHQRFLAALVPLRDRLET